MVEECGGAFKKLAKANNVEAFDLASEPLNESLAKMEQMK